MRKLLLILTVFITTVSFAPLEKVSGIVIDKSSQSPCNKSTEIRTQTGTMFGRPTFL